MSTSKFLGLFLICLMVSIWGGGLSQALAGKYDHYVCVLSGSGGCANAASLTVANSKPKKKTSVASCSSVKVGDSCDSYFAYVKPYAQCKGSGQKCVAGTTYVDDADIASPTALYFKGTCADNISHCVEYVELRK